MQLRKRNRKEILSLSVLYSALFAIILLSFPKQGGESANETSFFSAPKVAKNNLPISISWGASNKQTNAVNAPNTNTTSSSTKTFTFIPRTTRPIATTTKSAGITCASVGLCEKIHFADGYTTKEKTDYYKAILDVFGGIAQHLPQATSLQDTLYSLTLSNAAGERRGRGGSQTILIYTKDIGSIQEFREILTHELGHIIDLGVVKGTSSTLDTNFTLGGKSQFAQDDPSLKFYRFSRSDLQTRIASATYSDFVGGYAMTSPYEDFAESFTLFLWHHDIFAAMAEYSSIIQQKFLYINSLVQGFYFNADKTGLAQFIQTPKQRPWDITRMSLE